jgi:hypothetical protein
MQGMEEVEGGSSSLLMSSMSALPTLHENSELDLSDRPGPMSTSLLGMLICASPLRSYFLIVELIYTTVAVSFKICQCCEHQDLLEMIADPNRVL